LIDKINPTFIALTATATWKTGEFRVPPEFGPGGGAPGRCDKRNINHGVNNTYTDVFCRLDLDLRSSWPEVQAQKIDNICSMICQRIHLTGPDAAMPQPHNDQGSIAEDFRDYIPEKLIQQQNSSFNHLSSFVPATESGLRFSAVLPAITSSNQPVPCSNSNSNSNNITNMASIENMGLVKGSTIVDGDMSLGG
jgi:hypothetical protein